MLALALAVTALVGTPGPATATTSQPTKVAVVVLENKSYADITGCNTTTFGGVNPDVWTCNHLKTGGSSSLHGASMTNMNSGVNGTDKTTSAKQYAFMTSGDNCRANGFNSGNGAVDGTWNPSGQPALSTTDCGSDIFTQFDGASTGLTWKEYAEGFDSSVACSDGASESSTQSVPTMQNYVRRHSPGTFYTAAYNDCTGSPFNVLPFPLDAPGDSGEPLKNADNGNGHPFKIRTGGWQGFSADLNFVIPNLCHDGANSANQSSAKASCQVNDTGSQVTWSSGTGLATVTYSATNASGADFNVGEQVNLGGSPGFGLYNGLHYVASATHTTFTFTSVDHGPVTTSTGTVKSDGWGLDPSGVQIPHGCTVNVDICAEIEAQDAWLQYNMTDLQASVGATGVVVVIWDEGNGSSNQIPAFVVPGTGATLATTGDVTGAADHGSVIAALVTFGAANQTGGTAIACSRLDGFATNTLGYKACNGATTPLPLALTP